MPAEQHGTAAPPADECHDSFTGTSCSRHAPPLVQFHKHQGATIMTIDTTGYDDGDIDTNPTANPHLNELIASRYSRRQTLMGGLSAATAAVFGGMLLASCDDDDDDKAAPLTVTAGASGSAAAGRVVTLTGTVVGQADGVAWTQTAGPTVTLVNPNTATATFVVPGAAAGTVLTFLFTATSGGK